MDPERLSEIKAFVDTLFTRYFKDGDGYIELRFVGADVRSEFYRPGDIADLAADVSRLNPDHAVYVGVNPRPASKGKKQDDIKDVICLYADLDAKDFPGGKEEAAERIGGFPVAPSIVVDSGHGYHVYWPLAEPIRGISEEERLLVKQTLAGIVKRLGADRSKVNLDACLRLPGTVNDKSSEGLPPVDCRTVDLSDAVYQLEDFEEFRDTAFVEPEAVEGEVPIFGTRTKEISRETEKAAIEDVQSLETTPKTKRLIITGAMLREKDADKSRSGRDMAIIASLIFFNYDYATIRSVFFNPFVKCGNRIREEGEGVLRRDVARALQFVKARQAVGTPQSRVIASIMDNPMASAREKTIAMDDYVVNDLLRGREAAGEGFRDDEASVSYFFDRTDHILVPLEGRDFACYLRERFGLVKEEPMEAVRALDTAINSSGRTVQTHRVAYWDRERGVLYYNAGANRVQRLDGSERRVVDNGTDGVFFGEEVPMPVLPDPKPAANYFETSRPARRVGPFRFPARVARGLDWSRFEQDDVLLKKHLTDWASFEETRENPLSPDEQRRLLVVYFYSLLFESAMVDKPIATFVGQMESGKSTLAKLIGKILVGPTFDVSGVPKTADDLAVVMGSSYFVVIDNLDVYLKGEMTSALSQVATGVIVAKRKLFSDSTVTRIPVRSFLAVTTRDPRFKEGHPDLVDRMLLFNTRRVPLDRTVEPSRIQLAVADAGPEIMNEVLENANSIVAMLREPEREELGRPPLTMRHATDFEAFGYRVNGPAGRLDWRRMMTTLREKKERFSIEDADQFQLLLAMTYENGWELDRLTAGELYLALVDEAKERKFSEFTRHCPSSINLTRWIKNNRDGISQVFVVEVTEEARQFRYSIKALPEAPLAVERREVDAAWLADVRTIREKKRRGKD